MKETVTPAAAAGAAAADPIHGTCFAAGTAIATEAGETPVEVLGIGDFILTASGDLRPVKWIGWRSYAGRFLAANPDLLPIRIQPGALGAGLPRRGLLVSPKHGLFIDGRLVAAELLVDGGAITRAPMMAELAYFHIELDTHDILLAEGVPAESFFDEGSRAVFHNAPAFHALYPDAPPPTGPCAPRLESGPALDAIRQRLRNGSEPASQTGPLDGFIDLVADGQVTGWARDPNALGTPVRLMVTGNGAPLGEVTARQYRADLAVPGLSRGFHGFTFTIPGGLSNSIRQVIEVRRATDGRALHKSPYVIEPEAPARAADPAAEPGALYGQLESVTAARISGWAQEAGSDAPVLLQVLDNGAPLALMLANRHRRDLQHAGVGQGRHAFDLAIPGGLSKLQRHVIEVQRVGDGAALPFSPMVIEAACRYDSGLEDSIATALDGLPPGEGRLRALSFLMTQADRLRHSIVLPGESRPAPRALVIASRLPVAGRDGGSAVILSHMAALQRLGYAVHLAAADDLAGASPALEAAGIKTHGAPLHSSIEDLLRQNTGRFDLIYLRQAEIAARYMALARWHMPLARIVVSLPELLHHRAARQAAACAGAVPPERVRRLQEAETHAARAADAVLVQSAAEADWLRAAVPAADIHCVKWQIPPVAGRPAFAKRHGVAFIGHYGNPANIDAARWLADSVMPLVWETQPGLECLLAGAEMPDTIMALARPGLTPLGHVADLATVYDRVRLTVAPMRYGAGLCAKALDSLAAGLPCVMTEAAAEGLALPEPLQLLVAQDAAGLAALICKYHQGAGANAAAARAGLALIREHYSSGAVTSGLQRALGGAVAEAPRLVG